MWAFSVTDNGIGIEQEYADRVFEFGHRLHSGAIPGSGIGLTVCKTVVERHGGRIWVEPAAGWGQPLLVHAPGRGRVAGAGG